MKRLSAALLLCVLTMCAQGLWASAFAWAHLNSGGSGMVAGTITLGAQMINVTYTSSDLYFWQINDMGTDWWSGGACGGPCPVYNDPIAGISPPDTVDMIALVGNSNMHTLTFSTPVTNPVLAIISLGQPSVHTTYYFDHPFTILTSGGGWWGGGSLATVTGNGLQGTEGDGLVEFVGTYSEISWTGAIPEAWNGFNVGSFASSSTIPEPASMVLLGTGLLGIAGVMRSKRSKR
ncbi:MAG TPA: PEP-CTERM sorting domain-containing protein [Candidatus Eisenbacteria bacterium]|nr:PEP-CTERM sorting domain-containing protein [Candidatus Eisenbacteria bacterium]